jgi:hypothetical protein
MGSTTAKQPAVTCYGPARYSVEIRDIALPVIRDDEVLLEVANVRVWFRSAHVVGRPELACSLSRGAGS